MFLVKTAVIKEAIRFSLIGCYLIGRAEQHFAEEDPAGANALATSGAGELVQAIWTHD